MLELERGHCPCRVGDVLRGELLKGVVGMLCQGRQTLVRWRHVQRRECPAEICLQDNNEVKEYFPGDATIDMYLLRCSSLNRKYHAGYCPCKMKSTRSQCERETEAMTARHDISAT